MQNSNGQNNTKVCFVLAEDLTFLMSRPITIDLIQQAQLC